MTQQQQQKKCLRTVPLRHFHSLTYLRALSHLLKCVFSSRLSLWRPSAKVPPLRLPLLPTFPGSSLSSSGHTASALRSHGSFSVKFALLLLCWSVIACRPAGPLQKTRTLRDSKGKVFGVVILPAFLGSPLSVSSLLPWLPVKSLLCLSLCAQTPFFFPPPSSPKAPLCEMTQAIAWWNRRRLLRQLDLTL